MNKLWFALSGVRVRQGERPDE